MQDETHAEPHFHRLCDNDVISGQFQILLACLLPPLADHFIHWHIQWVTGYNPPSIHIQLQGLSKGSKVCLISYYLYKLLLIYKSVIFIARLLSFFHLKTNFVLVACRRVLLLSI